MPRLSVKCHLRPTHRNMIGAKRKAASRRSLGNPIRCFDQAAVYHHRRTGSLTACSGIRRLTNRANVQIGIRSDLMCVPNRGVSDWARKIKYGNAETEYEKCCDSDDMARAHASLHVSLWKMISRAKVCGTSALSAPPNQSLSKTNVMSCIFCAG